MRIRALLPLLLALASPLPLVAEDGDLVDSFFGDGIFVAGTTSHLLSLHGVIPAPDEAAVAFGHYIDKVDDVTTASGMHWRRVAPPGAGSECNVPIPGASFGWITAADFDSLGRLVVAGLADFGEYDVLVARFLYPACDLDESFDVDGIKTFDFAPDVSSELPANAVGVDNLYRINVDPFFIERDVLVAAKVGSDVGLARLDESGSFHTAFDGNGKVVFDAGGVEWPAAHGRGPSGELLVAGFTDEWSFPYDDFFVLGVQIATGLPAIGFGGATEPWARVAFDLAGGGDDWALDLAVTDEDRIYAAGSAAIASGTRAAVAALDPAGLPVGAFSGDGRIDFSAFPSDATSGSGMDALLVLSNDKLVLAGNGAADDFRGIVLARRNENGTADAGFGDNGVVRHAFDPIVNDPDDESVNVGGIAPVGPYLLIAGYAQDSGINREFLLLVENSLIFADDFESGSTSNW